MTRLTPTQREVLQHCPDWSAAFEVAERRQEEGARTDWRRTQDVLMSLHRRGLVLFGEPNGTYKISEKGLAALGASSSTMSDIHRGQLDRPRLKPAQQKASRRRLDRTSEAIPSSTTVTQDKPIRPLGYYWIKGMDGWTPWQWTAKGWTTDWVVSYYADEEVGEIGPCIPYPETTGDV